MQSPSILLRSTIQVSFGKKKKTRQITRPRFAVIQYLFYTLVDDEMKFLRE